MFLFVCMFVCLASTHLLCCLGGVYLTSQSREKSESNMQLLIEQLSQENLGACWEVHAPHGKISRTEEGPRKAHETSSLGSQLMSPLPYSEV